MDKGTILREAEQCLHIIFHFFQSHIMELEEMDVMMRMRGNS